MQVPRLGALLAGAAAGFCLQGGAARAAPDACGQLAALKLSAARVTAAARAPAGPPDFTAPPGAPPPPASLPAFCRVSGVAAPSVGFEVWLPEQGWNGRLLSVGNGGFGGAIPRAAMAEGLAQGYAVTGDDTGHQGEGRAWMADPAKVRLWGHSAVHLATAPAKAVVAAYYGTPARYAYFQGCSTGGAEAMEEAQAFPADYDGVVAGAPGMSYTHLMLSFLWGLKAADRLGGRLGPEQLLLLNRAALQGCDALDGAKDGLISDPPACRVDLAPLTCKPGQGGGCLSPAQLETARLIYQGPRNPRTGEAIYPGFAYGSEADPAAPPTSPFSYGWTGIQGPLAKMFAIPLLQDMVYHDPNWDWRRFDWDRDVADLDRRVSADITALDPDLRPFASRGGKLLMYQGWGDPLNAQTLPIAYRDQVIGVFAKDAGRAKGAAEVDAFLRVFMVPGMAHCGGGPGPSRFDALAALRAWVEQDRAPARIVAERPASPGAPAITRPLCPVPESARWTGRGNVDDASTYVCR